MIVLDTSLLVDALTGPRRSAPQLRSALEDGQRLLLPSLVLYEWLRGPRLREELLAQETLFPRSETLAFDDATAALAADLYRSVPTPRRREIDLGIAATTLLADAALWTLNTRDFDDIEELRLYRSA